MKRVFVAVLLAVSLTGCALFKPEPWARQIFAPSSQSQSTACDRGINSNQELPPIVGRVFLSPKVGELSFHSQLGQLQLLCYLAPSFARDQLSLIASIAQTYVLFQDSSVKRENVKVEISLERDGQELVRLKPSTVTPREESAATVFEFARLTSDQLTALEQTTSFSIIVNRGLGEERYAVNPTNLLGL